MIYYVSVNGSDKADGSKATPFQTINRAAKIAVAGDIVKVFGGTYREWVDPQNGGTSDHNRIVYEAVVGERPIIKGSEIVTDWQKVEGTVWKKELPNTIFGDWNPFALEVEGDWLVTPVQDYRVQADIHCTPEDPALQKCGFLPPDRKVRGRKYRRPIYHQAKEAYVPSPFVFKKNGLLL